MALRCFEAMGLLIEICLRIIIPSRERARVFWLFSPNQPGTGARLASPEYCDKSTGRNSVIDPNIFKVVKFPS